MTSLLRRPTLLVSGLVAASLTLTGCASLLKRGAEAEATPAPAIATVTPLPVLPLPGHLDQTLVFNSNSPEVVQSPGILVSTRPAQTPQEREAYLDLAFNGHFQVFSHHIAKDATPGERLLVLGLLAENPTDRPVTLRLVQGTSYLSQPDALFKPLPPVMDDPEGTVYAGPGDRVATDWLHGRSPIAPRTFLIPPHDAVLVYNLPIPTDVAILPPVNGRTTLIDFSSDGPLHLSEMAVFAEKTATGFQMPTRVDFERVLDDMVLAGPREAPPTAHDPGQPPPKGRFGYGRVAGVSRGAAWNGSLSAPGPGETVGFPISSVYLNRLGTTQVQSAPMVRRYPDTAYYSHGNYGVTYTLSVPLVNRGADPRTFTFALAHPAKVEGQSPATRLTFMSPPNRPVMFRGPVKLNWQDANGQAQSRFTHLVVQHGQDRTPIGAITVAPGAKIEATVSLSYPADATPPQLLTISSSP